MKNLNQDIITRRIRSDADLIETLCEIDVQDVVSNRLKDVKMVGVVKSIKSQRSHIQKLISPLVGVVVLTVIVFTLMLPMIVSNEDIQMPLLQNNTTGLVQVDNVSEKIDNMHEKTAIKDDIFYLTQVFSM